MQSYSQQGHKGDGIIRESAVLTTSYVAADMIKNIQLDDQLIIYYEYTAGSLDSAELKVEFSDELFYDLADDGQTSNFQVGSLVTGGTSGATGVIWKDTDGGATGTLVLRKLNGVAFQDDEAITDTHGGAAVVNGALDTSTASPSESSWFWSTEATPSSGSATNYAITHTLQAGRRRLAYEISDRFIRVSAKGTGTATGSLLMISAHTSAKY